MKIKNTFEREMATARNTMEAFEGQISRELMLGVDAEGIYDAFEGVKSLIADLEDKRALIQKWFQKVEEGNYGIPVPTPDGTPAFYVEGFHHGPLLNQGQREGFGLTAVLETDYNISGGYQYPKRFELGWSNPDSPLFRGMIFSNAYGEDSYSASALRSIDPNTQRQSGIWMVRRGGPGLSKPSRSNPQTDLVRWLGTFEPSDVDDMQGVSFVITDDRVHLSLLQNQRAPAGQEHLFTPAWESPGTPRRQAVSSRGGVL